MTTKLEQAIDKAKGEIVRREKSRASYADNTPAYYDSHFEVKKWEKQLKQLLEIQEEQNKALEESKKFKEDSLKSKCGNCGEHTAKTSMGEVCEGCGY